MDIIEPGYNKKFVDDDDWSQEEATRVRIRTEFKSKLNSLSVKHHRDQEFCPDCSTLPGTSQVPSGPSTVSIRRTSTTGTLGAQPKVYRRSVKGQEHEERSYGLSSESTEYFKVHPEFKTPGPNPKRSPHDETSNLLACFTNVRVAHEIAINRCYRLDAPVEEENGPGMQTQMKEIFWDLFKEEIETKKSYNQTIALISEIKDALHSLMMPHNHDLREEVNKILDLERLREQITKDQFDFECYTVYIISVLSKICCPTRDTEVDQLGQIKGPVPLFQAIFNLIEKMKCDLENFFINLVRPSIIKTCIENERKKFADYLELEYRLHEDGLRATRSWIHRHRVGVRDTLTVIAKAFGETLHWTTGKMWPETLLEDIQRFHNLRRKLNWIGIIGGVLLEIGKIDKKIFKNPPPGLRQIFSKYMKLLIPPEQTEDEEKLRICLENAAEHAIEATEMIIKKYLKRSMKASEKDQILKGVKSVADPQNNFRCLIVRRTIDYAEEVIIAAHEYHTTVPSTLTPVMYDVAILVSEFHRIVQHNQVCFGELYRDICDDRNTVPLYPEENDGNWDNKLLDTLKKLRSRIATPEEAREINALASETKLKALMDKDTEGGGEEKDPMLEDESGGGEKASSKKMDENGNFQTAEGTEENSGNLRNIDESRIMLDKYNEKTFNEFCMDCKHIRSVKQCHQ